LTTVWHSFGTGVGAGVGTKVGIETHDETGTETIRLSGTVTMLLAGADDGTMVNGTTITLGSLEMKTYSFGEIVDGK
jgi:hypothetical protein